MSLLFIESYKGGNASAFSEKVRAISAELGIDPNWLMAVMYKESKLNAQAVNPTTNATGLIQFMPATARGLGTSTDALYRMDAVSQLDYVRKYFLPYKNRLKSYFDTYIVVFFPAAVGKPDDWVFETKNLSRSKIAQQNKGIDLNRNGIITVGEFKEYLHGGFSAVAKNILAETRAVVSSGVKQVEKMVGKKKAPLLIVGLLTVTAITALIVYRKKIISSINKK